MILNLKLSNKQRITLNAKLRDTQQLGNLHMVKRILAILALDDGYKITDLSQILKISSETIRAWINLFLVGGLRSFLLMKKRSGRPPKLTKTQRKELYQIIANGPEQAGYFGACWRTPMIQDLILNRFGVYFNVRYISQLLKNMGFSFQKAKFVAAKQDEEKRENWLKNTWPELIKLAEKQKAMVLFGDECSFPQWGSLSYTWSPVGQTPTIMTSGTRKNYKLFGLIDYFTGKFFSKGIDGKLNGDSYIAFLKEVLSKTRKPIILIQDGAPYHKGKVVKEFIKNNPRLTVYTLPSYSPDFNPIEKLWKKIKTDGIHLKYFPTFDSLVNAVDEMQLKFKNCKEEILSLFVMYNEIKL